MSGEVISVGVHICVLRAVEIRRSLHAYLTWSAWGGTTAETSDSSQSLLYQRTGNTRSIAPTSNKKIAEISRDRV